MLYHKYFDKLINYLEILKLISSPNQILNQE